MRKKQFHIREPPLVRSVAWAFLESIPLLSSHNKGAAIELLWLLEGLDGQPALIVGPGQCSSRATSSDTEKGLVM